MKYNYAKNVLAVYLKFELSWVFGTVAGSLVACDLRDEVIQRIITCTSLSLWILPAGRPRPFCEDTQATLWREGSFSRVKD